MQTWMKTVTAAGLLLSGGVAQACALDAWTDGDGVATASNVGAVSPDATEANATNGIRYSGSCGMATSDNTAGSVNDASPGDRGGIGSGDGQEVEMRSRFYFYPTGGAGTAETIFAAYNNDAGTEEVYRIVYNGATHEITAVVDGTAAGGDNITLSNAVSATPNQWNSIEVTWVASSESGPQTTVYVNEDAVTGSQSFAGGPGTQTGIGSVALGTLSGTVNAMVFDDYESRRTQSIGLLDRCDANGQTTPGFPAVDINDAQAVLDEIVGLLFNPGQPDCDHSGEQVPGLGAVTIDDAQCVLDVITGNTPNLVANCNFPSP